MGRYDGEDYSDEHYLRKDLDRSTDQLEGALEMLAELTPKADRGFWVMATLGVGTSGAFSHTEAIKALRQKVRMSKPTAEKALARWLAKGLLWDWTDQSDPVTVHGVGIRIGPKTDVEKLVKQYGEPARAAYEAALQREYWYHLGNSGRTLARAIWPKGVSQDHGTTLHFSYGGG